MKDGLPAEYTPSIGVRGGLKKSFARKKFTAKVVLWCEYTQPTPKSDGKGLITSER